MATVKRVLVGADNFGSALIEGDPITKGTVIEVSEDVAINLDSHVRRDIANNAHPVFVPIDHPLAAPYVEQEEAPTKKRKKRSTAKKTVKKSVKKRATRKKGA